MNLKNKTVLVTGGSIGIGRATVIEFAKAGANIVINYHKSEDEAKNLLSEIERFGVKGLKVKADVSNEQEVKKLFKKANISNYKIMDENSLLPVTGYEQYLKIEEQRKEVFPRAIVGIAEVG